ncbi:hypothetical protein [Moorea bouillonii]|uniref:hypothetical protein n=1 Tax=Moorena bouillonii TaxID=207920 RepID=UPI001301883D
MGRWGDGEMGRWGDGEMGRWGDGEMGRFLLRVIIGSHSNKVNKIFSLFPTPDSQFPTVRVHGCRETRPGSHRSRFPIPDCRFPIADSRFLIPPIQ